MYVPNLYIQYFIIQFSAQPNITFALIKSLYYSLLLRFTDDKFDPDQPATIGVDFKVILSTINV